MITGKLLGRGQYTMVHLHDGKSMQVYLNCNMPSLQFFSRIYKTFSPNYTVAPLVITPELYIGGKRTNQIEHALEPVWKINGQKPIEFGGVTSPWIPYTLTINKNMVDVPQLNIEFSCVVVDPDTNLKTKLRSAVCFTKQEVDNYTPRLTLETPNGNVFRDNKPEQLIAVCDLHRGSQTITEGVERVWYELINGEYTEIKDGTQIYGQGTNTLTVLYDYINKLHTFKCDVSYEGAHYSEFITFSKILEQYTVKVVTTNGDKMKNGRGTVDCEAHIYLKDKKLPDEMADSMFKFQWKRFNRFTGEEDVDWRKPTTRQIKLTKDDVNTLSTFTCEVSLQNNQFTYVLPFIL